MAATIAVEDLLPGMWIDVGKSPVQVRFLRIDNYGNRDGEIMVTVNSSDPMCWKLGTRVTLVPPHPKITWRWDRSKAAYVIDIDSQGDVFITLNGHEVGDGVIHVPSERGEAVKELA